MKQMLRSATAGVIFDMDGTIVNTQEIHSQIESGMLAEHGIRIAPEEITRRFSGMSLKAQFDTLCDEGGVPRIHTPEMSVRKRTLFRARADEIRAVEGTVAVIEELYGRVPLAVASASGLDDIEFVLKKIGVRGRFDVISSTKETGAEKYDPAVFLLTAERLGMRPSACKVVEDGVIGMLGARAAEMVCVALAEDHTREYPAAVVVKDLREIPVSWFCR